MPKPEEYSKAVRKLKWPHIGKLWKDISDGTVSDWWEAGKAFEYLVVRMFELDGADVTWPYAIQHDEGITIEQIDGAAHFEDMHCLIESKAQKGNIAVEPIAKIRNQLLRRPWGTVGLVFTTTKFTQATVQLTQFALPQPILLWTGAEVSRAINEKKIREFTREKYRICVERGVVDWDITV